MKLLLVGPGKMKIPNDGWGAIEIVIWQLKLHLEALGHKVDILNKTGREAALKTKPWKYDYVHLHFDPYAPLWVDLAEQYTFELISTSHHAYAPFPKQWTSDYKHNFQSLLKIKKHLVLSHEIKKTYDRTAYSGKIAVFPNGTEISKIKFSKQPGNGKAICLGRIGTRKQQTKLSQLINTVGEIQCDFVGPISDRKFTYNKRSTNYLGEWNRRQVHHNLTNYSCLLIPSNAEAQAPLVALEALAAGLSVVVSPEASANLDTSLPFIYVDKLSENYIKLASRACQDNVMYRRQIRSYAERNFDWKIIAEKYVRILKEWNIKES